MCNSGPHQSQISQRRADLLNLLSDVQHQIHQNVGLIDDLPVPQFILIGKQSVGKSRLLEALAGELFNFTSTSLGSRRPTVLEFRHKEAETQWSYWKDTWQSSSPEDLQAFVRHQHESLGPSVSSDPLYVRVQSAHCVDMRMVDLPGFREFALDPLKQELANQIEALALTFMSDTRNILCCVEEAGDPANMTTLSRCKQMDPLFERTILVRTKLDKYYGDLDSTNVQDWLGGFGDLPESLQKFALSSPHFLETSLAKARILCNSRDLEVVTQIGVHGHLLQTIGLTHLATFLERHTEVLLARALNPLVQKLKAARKTLGDRADQVEAELQTTDPTRLLNTIRDVGKSFGQALQFVMEGNVRSRSNRLILEEELGIFLVAVADTPLEVPHRDFGSLEDYLTFLRIEARVPMYGSDINGGAMLRRLLYEAEIAFRLSEIGTLTQRKDVIQAYGVSVLTVTWKDVVVKLLTSVGQLPLERRIAYVGERIRWFFRFQKEVIVEFLEGIETSTDVHDFSATLSQNVRLLQTNPLIRQLVFQAYDQAVDRQLESFRTVFHALIVSTIRNPWGAFRPDRQVPSSEPVGIPSFEETKTRIFQEMDKSSLETQLAKWLGGVPIGAGQLNESVDRIQMLILQIFANVRSEIAEQIGPFADSFFKLPMLRRIEEEMANISFTEEDHSPYWHTRTTLAQELHTLQTDIQSLSQCILQIEAYSPPRILRHDV